MVGALRLAATPGLTLAAEDDAGLAVLGDGLPDWWKQQVVLASLATNGPIHSVTEVRANDDFRWRRRFELRRVRRRDVPHRSRVAVRVDGPGTRQGALRSRSNV